MKSERSDRILLLSGVDGRVYKMKKSDENLKLLKSFQGQVVKLTFESRDGEASIIAIQRPKANEVDAKTMDLNHFRYDQLRQFAPTDLQSVENATEVFENMLNDGDKSRSQCFKRAHMWAYDLWSKLGVNSQKVFIFYTQRYVQMEDFEWWFHVAPLVVVGGEDYVMDGTFMKKPIPLKEWKDFFIKTEKINCPVIENYQEFEKNQWSRLCYLMKVPMYFFSPLDIELRDSKGLERNHWVLEELQDARRAFKNSGANYEVLDSGKPTITY
ncbi:MAG TPA: protein-glutamine glutaminase family protein [Bacteriovoracaceae bacterium]|nr:protein-glutamine glutaminase family protein [Bacteriovoracaceae bacterium]